MISVQVHLNARLQPVDRHEFFEDPLQRSLSERTVGEITGGGTLQAATGEIQSCDIDIDLQIYSEQTIDWLAATLEELGAPKGSKLLFESGGERHFGRTEGMGVYLNGTDLDDEVYRSCDVNVVVSECEERLGNEGCLLSHWDGSTETALYFYGMSFSQMRERVEPFLAEYPLCGKCRVTQIA